MNVNIQTVHFDADSKLVSYIEKKISKLTQFHDRITSVDVYLKLDNIVHNIKDIVQYRDPPGRTYRLEGEPVRLQGKYHQGFRKRK